jgi:hypothetical protein
MDIKQLMANVQAIREKKPNGSAGETKAS